MKLTLKNTKKLFKKMSEKLSSAEFDRFEDNFWTTISNASDRKSVVDVYHNNKHVKIKLSCL